MTKQFSGWPTQGDPLSPMYLTFPYEFTFTKRDLKMFESEHAHTSLGFKWLFCSFDEIYIHRGGRCYFLLTIKPDNKHIVRAYVYPEKNDNDLVKWFQMLHPIETLTDILKKWTGHSAILKMIDLHCHVVPRIDDGSSSLEMSLEMIKTAYDQGVRGIACTSHSWGNMTSYKHNLASLQKLLVSEKLNVRLYPGCEIDCSENNDPSIIDGVENHTYLPLGNSQYIMLEFSPHCSAHDLLSTVKGILEFLPKRIVIAHAERYPCLHTNALAVDTLLNWGCHLQINAYSLVKEKKPEIKLFARKLLHNQKVSFLGSDAHRSDHRPPDVKDGIKYVYDMCNVNYANDVCYNNANKLLMGQVLPGVNPK